MVFKVLGRPRRNAPCVPAGLDTEALGVGEDRGVEAYELAEGAALIRVSDPFKFGIEAVFGVTEVLDGVGRVSGLEDAEVRVVDLFFRAVDLALGGEKLNGATGETAGGVDGTELRVTSRCTCETGDLSDDGA